MEIIRCVRCGSKLSGDDVRITEGVCNYCDRKEQNEKFFGKTNDDNQDALKYGMQIFKDNAVNIKIPIKQILLVEDGSVDTDKLVVLNIPFVVYRKGSTSPMLIKLEG